MELELYKPVIITQDFPEYNLYSGDIATLIDSIPHPEQGEEGAILEIFSEMDESVKILTVPQSSIQPWQPPIIDERVKAVSFTETMISVTLQDDRVITVPLTWYPRLLWATPEQRQNWAIHGAGDRVRWEMLHQDLKVETLLRGVSPATATVHH
jgi:hypothetical protein